MRNLFWKGVRPEMISILITLAICNPVNPVRWIQNRLDDMDEEYYIRQNMHQELKSKVKNACYELESVGFHVHCDKDESSIKGSDEEAEKIAKELSFGYAEKFVSSNYLSTLNGFQSVSRSLKVYPESQSYVTSEFYNRFELFYSLGIKNSRVPEILMNYAIQVEARLIENTNYLSPIATTDLLIQDIHILNVCKKSKKNKDCLQKLYEFHLRFSSDKTRKKDMIVESFAIQKFYFHPTTMNPLQSLFQEEINSHEMVLKVKNKMLFEKERLKESTASKIASSISYRLSTPEDDF